MRRRLWLAALAIGAALGSACSDTDMKPLPTVGSTVDDPVVLQPSLARDIQPIFSARCAIPGCHVTATEANLGLVLKDAPTSYANLVNVPSGEVTGDPPILRVRPGDASGSWLIFLLEAGTTDDPLRMPKAGEPLSANTIQTIRNWIDQGAQDN